MTVELLEVGPDDIEEALSTYFGALRRSGSAWETDDGLPFTIITALTGGEDPEIGTASPLVQVDTLCDKSLGYEAARDECRKTHQRALYLARFLPGITLSGRIFGCDYVKVVESPTWKPFGDTTVLRKVGRYEFGLGYVPLPA